MNILALMDLHALQSRKTKIVCSLGPSSSEEFVMRNLILAGMNVARLNLSRRKNVNLIGVHAGLPIMNEQDKKDIAFGVEMDVDYIAASFISYPHEVSEIRKYLESMIRNTIKVVSDSGIADKSDTIIFIVGLPLQGPQLVNTIRVLTLGTEI